MQHPTPERLAELADVVPGSEEASHLATCDSCAREVQSYRSLGGMAAHIGALESGGLLTDWDSLSARLRAEGLIRPQHEPATRQPRSAIWMLRIAAGLLLFFTGAMAGRGPLAPQSNGSVPGDVAVVNGEVQFESEEAARTVLLRAERDYQLAATWLAAHGEGEDGLFDPDLIRTRLAVFDAAAGAAREAIFDAPHDPVINQYYMSTLAAREATLQQLASALPSGLSRF